MIFPPDSLIRKRRALLAEVEAGALTPRQAFERALELDPHDTLALAVLALERQSAGDLPGAEEYFWRTLKAQPCEDPSYLGLSAVLLKQGQRELSTALLELGLRKILLYEASLKEFQQSLSKIREPHPRLPKSADRETLEACVEELARARDREPESVAEVLRPYRLIHDLQEAGNAIDRELVDEILQPRTECAPLLTGILRGWATRHLPDEAAPVVRASLALLGEIGHPESLPDLLEFSAVERSDLRHAADWAIWRIAQRRPADAVAVFRQVAADVDFVRRASLVDHLVCMPATGGRREALLGLLDAAAGMPKRERQEFFMIAAAALLETEGPSAREAIQSALRRHSGSLPKATAGKLRELFDNPLDLSEPPGWARGTVYDVVAGEIPGRSGFEAAEPEPLPPREKPVVPARNAPCWCGSGRKYKKCHLEADERALREGQPAGAPGAPGDVIALAAGLRSRVLSFMDRLLDERDLRDAFLLFFGPKRTGAEADEENRIAFFDWLMHDYIPKRLGRPVIEEYLERNRARLAERERRILEAMASSRFSLYEVQQVERGAGLRVQDLLTAGELFLHDVSLSNRAARWDCLLLRVEDLEGKKTGSGIALLVARNQSERLRQWIVADREKSGLPWPVYLRANSHRIRRQAYEIGEESLASLRVVSAEGDPVVFSQAVYRILDKPALLRALDASAVIERAGPDAGPDGIDYTWFEHPKLGNEPRRVLGTLHIEGGRLRLECQTRERLSRGKELLVRLAPGLLEQRRERFTPIEKLKRRAAKEPPEPGIPPEVARQIVQEHLDEHYRTWPDTPLPALDGMTPREAVATDEGRGRVRELLKLIENGEERKRLAGDAWYDVSKLRAELEIGS